MRTLAFVLVAATRRHGSRQAARLDGYLDRRQGIGRVGVGVGMLPVKMCPVPGRLLVTWAPAIEPNGLRPRGKGRGGRARGSVREGLGDRTGRWSADDDRGRSPRCGARRHGADTGEWTSAASPGADSPATRRPNPMEPQ